MIGSAEGTLNFIKELSLKVLTAHLPMNFILAEIEIPVAQLAKYKVVLGILSRNVVIDATDEDDGATATTAARAFA